MLRRAADLHIICINILDQPCLRLLKSIRVDLCWWNEGNVEDETTEKNPRRIFNQRRIWIEEVQEVEED